MDTRQNTGRMRWRTICTGSLGFQISAPVGKYGKPHSLNCTANNSMQPKAMKKMGMEYPMKEKDVIRLSIKEYCRTAATSPSIREMTIMKTSAVDIRIKVIGRRCWIISSTG